MQHCTTSPAFNIYAASSPSYFLLRTVVLELVEDVEVLILNVKLLPLKFSGAEYTVNSAHVRTTLGSKAT